MTGWKIDVLFQLEGFAGVTSCSWLSDKGQGCLENWKFLPVRFSCLVQHLFTLQVLMPETLISDSQKLEGLEIAGW